MANRSMGLPVAGDPVCLMAVASSNAVERWKETVGRLIYSDQWCAFRIPHERCENGCQGESHESR